MEQTQDEKNDTKAFQLSEEQIEEVRRAAVEKARNTKHDIRQRGPHIVCVSCEFPHTVMYVGVSKRMIGINQDGSPLLKNLTE